MARRRVKVQELVEADVKFVSLVHRPANRLPFRVTKGEGVMDLSTVFRTKEDTTPRVVSLAVRKGAVSDGLKKTLKAAGFTVDVVSENEHAAVYKQSDLPHTGIARINDDVVALVSGPIGSAFADVRMKTDGFKALMDFSQGVAPVDEIVETMKSEIDAAMKSGDTVRLEAALDDGRVMLTKLQAVVPAAAFQIEKAKVEHTAETAQTEDTDAGAGDQETTKGEGTKEAASETAEATAGTEQTTDTAKSDAAGNCDDDMDDDKKKGKGKDKMKGEDGDDAVLTAIEALGARITGLEAQVSKAVTTAEQAAQTASKTESALRGVVPGDAPDDKTKSDRASGAGAPPLLDTAYTRNVD